MKMTLHRYRNWSLATRQFLFLFLVTSAMLGLLVYNNYTRAAGLFKEQMLTDAWKLSGRTNQFLDTYLDNSQNILQLLSESTPLLSTGNEVSIEKYLRSLTESNSTLVKHLYLLRSDGRVFCDSQLTYEIIGNPKLQEHEAMARQNWGSIISQPYVSPLSGRTVAIFRSIRDKQGRL
ncbi:PDC sensor domain-containing protein [Paenibacillus sp. CC-CFT747]|nr:PDC sensor domain-containing protein [Paenibacillus sp. CC-CFT747]